MGELLRQLAVIREKEQALSLRVEPADVEELGEFLRKQIENRVAGMSVFARGNKTSGFVQQDGEGRIEMEETAIHFHVVTRHWLPAKVGADFAVDRDAAGRDQFVAMAPRTDAGGGEKAVQTHCESEKLQKLNR